jgi:hypothetical protein
VLDGAVVAEATRAAVTSRPQRGGPGLRRVAEVLEDEHDAFASGAALAHERAQVAGPGLDLLPRRALEGRGREGHELGVLEALVLAPQLPLAHLVHHRLDHTLRGGGALADDRHAPVRPARHAVEHARGVTYDLDAVGLGSGLLGNGTRGSAAAACRVGGLLRRRDGLLDVGLDLGAGEAGLAHDAADAGVVEDGDDELVELHLGGDVLLVLDVRGRAAAPALVPLRALERSGERVGQRRLAVAGVDVELEHGRRRGRAPRRREAVEGDVEAELQRLALERVGGRPRPEAGGAEEAPGVQEHGAGDVQRRDLRVPPATRQAHRLPHHGGRVPRQLLLHRAAAATHLCSTGAYYAGRILGTGCSSIFWTHASRLYEQSRLATSSTVLSPLPPKYDEMTYEPCAAISFNTINTKTFINSERYQLNFKFKE